MKEPGYENNPAPRDESDSRDLVPEMMRRLYAGEHLPLSYNGWAIDGTFNLADYFESAAHLYANALAAELIKPSAYAYTRIESAIRDAVEAECEKDAGFYANALRLQ